MTYIIKLKYIEKWCFNFRDTMKYIIDNDLRIIDENECYDEQEIILHCEYK